MSAAILLGVHFFLPESREPNTALSLRPAPIIKNFASVAREPQFYIYCLTGSIAAAGLYAYIAGSPSVFMELLKVSEKQYGWIFAGVAAGLITTSQINSFLLRKYESHQVITVACLLQSAAGIAIFAAGMLHLLTVFNAITLCFCFLCCQGLYFLILLHCH